MARGKKKVDDEIVTNLQNSPMIFVGEQKTDTVTIAPRSSATVPGHIWARYCDRKDIQNMDGTKIVIGGATPEEIAEMTKTPEAQRAALDAMRKQMATERAELNAARESMEADLREKIMAELQGRDPDSIVIDSNEEPGEQ